MSPPTNIYLCRQWLDNSLLNNIVNSDDVYIRQVDIFSRRISNFTVIELISMFDNSKLPLYGAYSGDLFDHYLSYVESTEKLLELLQFQCTDYIDFLKYLYNLLNRSNGKQNCLQLLGPANSCKTTFVQIISEFCICTGKIANFNRYSQFPLQNCVNKRLLYWDEPDCEASGLETIKILFGGDTCPANIKYKDHQLITKTPVIVTANRNIFPRSDVWECRMRTMYWQQYNLQVHKRIHPVALINLFRSHVLVD